MVMVKLVRSLDSVLIRHNYAMYCFASKRHSYCIGFCARIVFLAVLLLGSGLMPVPALAEDGTVPGKEQTLNLNASANHSQRGYKKILYGWPVPENALFTGISGSISTRASRDAFNQALISVRWIPSGACPQYGEAYNYIEQVLARYPNTQRLVQFIIKKPTVGDSTLPVNFELPVGMPISHCVYVIFEGSTLTGGPYTMTSKLALHYSVGTPPPRPLKNNILGDEFCWGMENGCGKWHTTDNTKSFASFSNPVSVDTELVALHGNISSSVFPPTPLPRYIPYGSKLIPHFGMEWHTVGGDAPVGEWSVTNDVYIFKNCSHTPSGLASPGGEWAGPGDFYNHLPPDAVKVLEFTMEGHGMQSLQQPVHKDFANVVIPKGGCMAHLVERTGTGGIDSEFQVMAFTRAAQ